MPLNYLDSSALAKRYVPEIGSSWVRQLCAVDFTAMSVLSIVELHSVAARRTREGMLTAAERDEALAAFVSDSRSFTVITMSAWVVQRAGELLLSMPATARLRSLDALHIASAERAFARAHRRGTPTGSFVTADRALLAAAAWVGLPVDNPEDHP